MIVEILGVDLVLTIAIVSTLAGAPLLAMTVVSARAGAPGGILFGGGKVGPLVLMTAVSTQAGVPLLAEGMTVVSTQAGVPLLAEVVLPTAALSPGPGSGCGGGRRRGEARRHARDSVH